jgi:hypothetical protein
MGSLRSGCSGKPRVRRPPRSRPTYRADGYWTSILKCERAVVAIGFLVRTFARGVERGERGLAERPRSACGRGAMRADFDENVNTRMIRPGQHRGLAAEAPGSHRWRRAPRRLARGRVAPTPPAGGPVDPAHRRRPTSTACPFSSGPFAPTCVLRLTLPRVQVPARAPRTGTVRSG